MTVLLLIMMPVRAEEEPVYTNGNTGFAVYIDDEADLLSDQEETKLLNDMIPVTEYGGAAFVSVSRSSMSTNAYAKERYRGYFGTDSGTLLIIDMDNREIWIFSDGAVYKTVTRSYANSITDNIYEYASDGDYYSCASAAFAQINTLLEGGKIAQPMKHITNILIALISAVLINYILVMYSRRKDRVPERQIEKVIPATVTAAAVKTVMTKRREYRRSESTGSGGYHGGSSGGFSGGSSGGGFSSGGSSGGGGGHKF